MKKFSKPIAPAHIRWSWRVDELNAQAKTADPKLEDWTCPDSTDSLEVLDLLGIFNRIDLSVAVN
jgi:hypothetical protein